MLPDIYALQQQSGGLPSGGVPSEDAASGDKVPQQAAAAGAKKRARKNPLMSLLEEAGEFATGREVNDLGDVSQLLNEERKPRTDRSSVSRRGAAVGDSSGQNGARSEGASTDAAAAAAAVAAAAAAAAAVVAAAAAAAAVAAVAAAEAAPHAKKQKRVSRELANLQDQHLQQQGAEVAGTRSWRS